MNFISKYRIVSLCWMNRSTNLKQNYCSTGNMSFISSELIFRTFRIFFSLFVWMLAYFCVSNGILQTKSKFLICIQIRLRKLQALLPGFTIPLPPPLQHHTCPDLSRCIVSRGKLDMDIFSVINIIFVSNYQGVMSVKDYTDKKYYKNVKD